MYKIWFELKTKLLRIEIEGFWDSSTGARFSEELVARSKAVALQHPVFDILTDARTFSVQKLEVGESFRDLAHRGIARRAAIVVTSPLATLQARRNLETDRVRIFCDMNAALAWLSQA